MNRLWGPVSVTALLHSGLVRYKDNSSSGWRASSRRPVTGSLASRRDREKQRNERRKKTRSMNKKKKERIISR